MSKVKRNRGNPNFVVKYTPEFVTEIKQKLDKYIDETDMPILFSLNPRNGLK